MELYSKKTKGNFNGKPDRLSLSRNIEAHSNDINNKTKTKTAAVAAVTNDYIQKMKLKIYISCDGRKFIEKSAAYALGLISDKNFHAMENKLNFFEISDRQLEAFKNRNIEIEYCQISDEMVPKKTAIKVFRQGINYYIELSSAYALGLISDKNFYVMGNQLYQINDNLLVFLNNKYTVEMIEISSDVSLESSQNRRKR